MKTLYKITLFAVLLVSAGSVFAQQAEREKGIELYRQGEYEKATEALQSYVKTGETDRLAWIYLGGAYVKLKKDKEAGKAFRQANGLKGENLPAYDKKLKILSKMRVNYTELARTNNAQGTVILAVEFGADGKIGFTFPVQKLPYGLTENVAEAAKFIKFEPAVKDGKAITTISFISYSFSTY